MDKEVVCGMKRFLGFYTKTVRDIFPDSHRTRIYCASKRIVLTLSKCTILGYVREIEFICFFVFFSPLVLKYLHLHFYTE